MSTPGRLPILSRILSTLHGVRQRGASLFFLLVLPWLAVAAGPAQPHEPPFEWSQPERIPEYGDMLRAPLLVADAGGTVHAFDLELDGQQRYVILHRRWTLSGGWSSPTDILLSEFMGTAPALEAVTIDGQQRIHLVYYGGDVQGNSVYYTAAAASEADSALAWSDPVPVGVEAGVVGAAGLAANQRGDLALVYAGDHFGDGVYGTISKNNGADWSDAILISRSHGENLWPAYLSLVADEAGRFHAVWGTVNEQGLQEDVRYARLEADFSGWGHETTLARMDNGMELVGAPGIVASPEGLVVAYEDSFPPTKWVRRSSDWGETWSAPVRPFYQIGGYGRPALVVDSGGVVHMLVGNRIPDPETSGMWYSRLVDNNWPPLKAVSARLSAPDFGPCCAQAVVTGGNLLLATWPHNVTRDFLTGAWYSYAWLDAPPIQGPVGAIDQTPPTAVPLRSTVSEPVRPASTGASVRAETEAESGPQDRATPKPIQTALPIFLGTIPVVALLGYWMISRQRGRGTERDLASPRGPDDDGSGGSTE